MNVPCPSHYAEKEGLKECEFIKRESDCFVGF